MNGGYSPVSQQQEWESTLNPIPLGVDSSNAHLTGWTNYMKSISETELLDELRTLAGKLYRHPHTHDMAEYGAYSPQTYQDRFGSWKDAMKAAGLADLRSPALSDEEVLEALQAVASDLETDAPPTHDQVQAHGPYSPWLYIDRFESWIAALEAAGFETQARIDPDVCQATTVELEHALQQIATAINRTPTAAEMDTYGDYASLIYQARFGSWEKAVAAADLAPPAESRQTVYTETELLEHLREVTNDLGRPPTVLEMNECDGPSALTYQYRFGSWHSALTEAGVEPSAENDTEISDEALLDELQALAADLETTPTREEMNKHGEYSPTTYARRFGSWNAALRAADLPPNQVTREETPN